MIYFDIRPGAVLDPDGNLVESNFDFKYTGTTQEWYSILSMLIVRCSLFKIEVSPDVQCILENTVSYRPSLDKNDKKSGTLSGKIDVYVNPFRPRNLIELDGESDKIICVKGMGI